MLKQQVWLWKISTKKNSNYVNEETSGGKPPNDASVETESIDDESNDVNKVGSSSSDKESFDDFAVNGDYGEDEEITADEVVSSFPCISSSCSFTLKMDTVGA